MTEQVPSQDGADGKGCVGATSRSAVVVLAKGPKVVIPAKTSPKGEVSRNGQAGIHFDLDRRNMDSRFRGNDEYGCGVIRCPATGCAVSRCEVTNVRSQAYQTPTTFLIASAIPGAHPNTGAGLRKPPGPGNGAVYPPASSIRSSPAIASQALSDSSTKAS